LPPIWLPVPVLPRDGPPREENRPVLIAAGLLTAGGLAGAGWAGLTAGAAPLPLGLALFAGACGLGLAAWVTQAAARTGGRLRGDLAQALRAATDPDLPLPGFEAGDLPGTDARLVALARALAETARAAGGRGDARLAALISALPVPLMGVGPTGLVTLVNPAMAALIGAVTPGTSVYAALARESLAPLLAAPGGDMRRTAVHHVDGRLLDLTAVQLPVRAATAGWLIFADPPVAGMSVLPAADLPMALALHDLAPDLPPADDATSLDRLPLLSLDLETTGLEVTTDRMVSAGAVCMVGGRLFLADVLDMLVDPGIPIPAAATRIHGIDRAMLQGAPPPSVAVDRLTALAAGRVVVGHNIGFDLAVLRAEAARTGHPVPGWLAPGGLVLDTLRLAARLDPDRPELDLEAIASRYGIAVSGRHTALGDALLTGRVFAAMIPRLAEMGVHDLGGARRFADGAGAVAAAQRRAGW
jgi:DNA polymerase-3 subunit epsilon